MPVDVNPASTCRLRSRIEWLIARRQVSRRAGSLMLLAAGAVFLVVTALSFRSLAGHVEMHWWVLPILLLVTGPLTQVANAAEFRYMGLINGHRIGWLDSVRLTVAASAANLLPLPGGVVIRIAALRQRGSSYRRALAANGVAGLIWIGCAALVIAILYTVGPHDGGVWLPAAGLTVLAIACLTLAGHLLRRTRSDKPVRLFVGLLVIEAGTVFVGAARIFFAFRLIGLSATAPQSVALTAAQIVAAAIGIFPGGLGLRETLAGGIGALVHLGAGPAVAASAADRVTGEVSIAIIGGIVILLRLAGAPESPAVAPDVEPLPHLHDTP